MQCSRKTHPHRSIILLPLLCLLWAIAVPNYYFANAFSADGGIKSRAFLHNPYSKKDHDGRPKLILISGCSGTGKSTFGMSVALDQGILKCISTDTLRSVMRSFIDRKISPALHRSSFEPSHRDGSDDPIETWRETCTVLEHSVEELVDEMIGRGVSLVVEGVHVVPTNSIIRKWEEAGGVAVGVVLCVSDEDSHRRMLLKRGDETGRGEETKLRDFERVRAIHDEMIRLGQQAGWELVEQDLRPDPLERVAGRLVKSATTANHLVADPTLRQKAADEEIRYYQTASSSSSSSSSNNKHNNNKHNDNDNRNKSDNNQCNEDVIDGMPSSRMHGSTESNWSLPGGSSSDTDAGALSRASFDSHVFPLGPDQS